jgi:hypothetical protein
MMTGRTDDTVDDELDRSSWVVVTPDNAARVRVR